MAYNAAKTDIGRYTGYETFRKCGIAFLCIFCVAFVTNCASVIAPPLFAA